MKQKIKAVYEYVRRELADAPGCHDWDHTQRVYHNALIIAKKESQHTELNLDIIETAALLHDIGRVEELKCDGKICHAELGAKLVPEILRTCGINDSEFIAKVADCVRKHRFRTQTEAPETIEEKIIFDADKLDSIGAVGIARAIHFSGRIGSRLHNTEEEALAASEYSSEDSAYREYLVKLRYIPERMLTETGRKLAVERAEFMHIFFQHLNNETGTQ